jgi:hypothetical protein
MKAVGNNKLCSRCKAWKPIPEFNKDRTQPDGNSCQCRQCVRESRPVNMREMNRIYTARAKDRIGSGEFSKRQAEYTRRCRLKKINPEAFPDGRKIRERKVLIVNDNKCCSRCKMWKPVSEFYRERYRADGLLCHCKACQKEYLATPKMKMKLKEQAKERWQRLKQRPDDYKEYQKKQAEYHRQQVLKDPEAYRRRHAETNKLWREKNPEKYQKIKRRYEQTEYGKQKMTERGQRYAARDRWIKAELAKRGIKV